jgi:hypothetical protein
MGWSATVECNGGVAVVGEASQLVHVALLGGEFDQLVNRVLVTVSSFPQDGQIGSQPR